MVEADRGERWASEPIGTPSERLQLVGILDVVPGYSFGDLIGGDASFAEGDQDGTRRMLVLL